MCVPACGMHGAWYICALCVPCVYVMCVYTSVCMYMCVCVTSRKWRTRASRSQEVTSVTSYLRSKQDQRPSTHQFWCVDSTGSPA